MGPANQPVSRQTQQQQQPQHITSKHPKFQNAKIFNFKNQTFFQVSQSIANINSYQNWQKGFNEMKSKIQAHSLYLPIQCQYQQEGFCGSAGILKFKFDYFPFLLDQQILNRQNQGKQFQQKQLWFLLFILVQTAAALHKIGYLVGDIRPGNVFISQTGDISLYNTFTFPQQFTNFQKIKFFNQSNYLPPEGVNDIQTGKQIPSFDQILGQSFSIGLTLLDAIFLTEHSFLYYKMQRFNQIEFLQIIKNLQKLQINPHLKRIIAQMLSLNPQKRLSCSQVYNYLAPYKNEIFTLEQFQIKDQIRVKSQSSNVQSPNKVQQRISKQGSKSRRKNLVRYSMNKSQRSNPVESPTKQNENMEEIRNQTQWSDLNHQQQKVNQQSQYKQTLSNRAEFSTVKNIQRLQEHDDLSQQRDIQRLQNMRLQQTNNNRSGQLSKVRHQNSYKNFNQHPNVQNINNQLYHIQKPQLIKPIVTFNKDSNYQNRTSQFKTEDNHQIPLVFKTGTLFHKQRPSQPLIQTSENNEYKNKNNQIRNLGYQNSSYKEQQPKGNYQYEFNMKKQVGFQPAFNYSSKPNASTDTYNDFLKQIDRQIQQSRRLFPDSFK